LKIAEDLRRQVFDELERIEDDETARMLRLHLAENDRQARNRISYTKYIGPLSKQFKLAPEDMKILMRTWGAHV